MPYTPNNNPYIDGDPYSYDLNWIVAKINEYAHYQTDINNLQNDIEALKEYVDNFIDNLDIQEAVNNKIDEMLNDGSLTNIINDAVLSAIEQKTTKISRLGRFIDRYTINGTLQVLRNQSCCWDGTNYYTCGSYNSDANQSICRIDENGNILNDNQYTQLGHANDIACDENYLYVATGSALAVVDKSTLAYITSITPLAISTVRAVAVYNGLVYMIGASGILMFSVESYNPATNEQLAVLNNIHDIGSIPQGSTIANGYLYNLYNRGSQVSQIDLANGEIVRIFNIPLDDGFYYVGEPETLLVKDNIIYLFSAWYNYNFANDKAAISQIFGTDIISKLETNANHEYHPTYTERVFTVNESDSTVFNPFLDSNTIEDYNIIVPDLPLRIENSTHGHICRPQANTLNISRVTSAVIDNIEIIGSDYNLNGITVNRLMVTYGNGSIINCSLPSVSLQQTNINIITSTIGLTNIERSNVNYENSVVNIDGSTLTNATGALIKVKNPYAVTRANFNASILTGIKSLLTPFGNTRVCIFSFDVEISSGVVYPMAFRATKGNLSSNLTKTTDVMALTIASDGTLTATVSGTGVTVSQILNFEFTITP